MTDQPDRPDEDGLRWKYVPCEPTQEMVRAAYREQPDTINAGFAQAYRAMLSASPTRDGAEGAGESNSDSGAPQPRGEPVQTNATQPTGSPNIAPPKPAPSQLGVEITASFKEAIASAQKPAPDAMRKAINRLAEIHVGAWLQKDDARLQIVPTAARQDIRDFADAVLKLVSSAAEPEPEFCERCNERLVNGQNIFITKTGIVHFPKCPCPPVRGDREAIIRILKSQIRTSSPADDIEASVINAEKVADAILSLHVQPGAGEREANLCPSVWHNLHDRCASVKDATRLSITKEDMDHAFEAARKALSRQAPHSSSKEVGK